MKEQSERIIFFLQENRDRFVSGAALGSHFSISRAAVWKQAQALRPLSPRLRRGERGAFVLTPFIPLDLAKVALAGVLGDRIRKTLKREGFLPAAGR